MVKSRKEVVKAILLVNDSFASHLAPSVGVIYKNKCCNKAVGKPSFHVLCLKEYLAIMKVLVDQL